MPDTIKTLAQLNLDAQDNASGGYSLQKLRDLMVSFLVHGEIGSLAKAAITLGTGYQALDFNASGAIERGVTVDTVNKWIVVPVDGKYEVTLEVSFNGGNNTTYDFTVFKNPDTSPENVVRIEDSERLVNAAMIGGVKVSCSLTLVAGDKLQAGVRSNGSAFTLRRGLLRVRRIGIE